MGNNLRTVFFLGLLTGLMLAVGLVLGGESGLTIAFIFSLIMAGISYFWGAKLVLAMYRAQEVSAEQQPVLHRAVDEVVQFAEIPKPKLFIIRNASPNAFATGRNPKNSSIAVTTGLMNLLNESELKGVIAHEVAHIKNRDTLISVIAAVIAGTIAYLATMARWAAIFGGFSRDKDSGINIFELIALTIITPLIATLIQLAVSRAREFQADETAAKTLHSYVPLVSALEKLSEGVKARPMAHANQGTAHLFIVNPFTSEGFFALFQTHPPLKKRIEKLRNLNF